MTQKSQSVLWVTGLCFLFVLWTSWGFLAVSWVGAKSPSILELGERERSELVKPESSVAWEEDPMAIFTSHALGQLPHAPQILVWHFRNRLWLLVLIGAMLSGVLVGGVMLKRLERHLEWTAPRIPERE